MKERWIEYTKKADFEAWGKELRVSPLTARLIRNRDVTTVEEARSYLYGTMKDLSDPLLMKDLGKGAALLIAAVKLGEQIAIVSDFDDDGIFAGEILYEGLIRAGGQPRLYTPNRVAEGYGINERIIDAAKADGCRMILTCDNGIAAVKEIAYAKSVGMTVIVTDHHEVQLELPAADAVIDPKQPDCRYPYKSLCGAGVALRLIEELYRRLEIPEQELEKLFGYAAIATVADVVELIGENRIIVREGLKKLHETTHPGLCALIDACSLKKQELNAYHLGFVIGPSFNAVGRLSDVKLAFQLLQTEDPEEARKLALEIRTLNETRKEMTEDGFQEAVRVVEEEGLQDDQVLIVRLFDVHESVVGIIAGRLKEKYYRPVFVFTDTEQYTPDGKEILKGSGRSIPGYHMMNELLKQSELPEKFGGHAMAAGLSIAEDKLPLLKKALNDACTLTEEEMTPVVYIDARVPLAYLSEQLIQEMDAIQPTGTGNTKAVFARPHFKIHEMRLIGKNRNILKMTVSDDSGRALDALLFRETEEFLKLMRTEFGEREVEKAFMGQANALDAAFCYTPSINEYNGRKTIQIVCGGYCRIR